MYKDGEHFLLPCKSDTRERQRTGASSCIGVNSETALRAQLASAPRAILTERQKKKQTAALEEPDEENLAKRSIVEWLVAKLLSVVSKTALLFILCAAHCLFLS